MRSRPRSLQDRPEQGRDRIFPRLANASTSRTVRSQIRDLYGSGARGGINTAAAAADLGVSARTVRRWASENRLPERSTKARDLQSAHRRWSSSPAGRRARLGGRREQKMRQNGAFMRFGGRIKISSDDQKRFTSFDLTGDQMGTLLDAALSGDDQLTLETLEGIFSDDFGGDVSLGVDSIEFDPLD